MYTVGRRQTPLSKDDKIFIFKQYSNYYLLEVEGNFVRRNDKMLEYPTEFQALCAIELIKTEMSTQTA